MPKQFSISQLLLWLFVIVCGIELGGALYETLVVLPVWAHSPPDSVLAYYHHNKEFPQFILNAGGRFWILFTPLTGLLALAALLTGLRTAPAHRKWRMIGSGLALLVVIWTFAWFVPNLIFLFTKPTTVSGPELASLTNWWVSLNWVRAALLSAAWLAALYAMTIPSQRTAD